MKRRPPTLLWIVGSAVAGLCFAGCASTEVKVDAVSQPDAEKSIAYQIKTSNAELDPESLRYKEAEKFVKTALSGKGLYEAPKAEMADMVVNLDYGIGPPKVTQERRFEPIYITVPGETYPETVTATDANGKSVTYTVWRREPDRTVHIGDREYMVTIVTYEKFIRLSARENKPVEEGQPPAEIWTVDVSTEGESRDLRKALPVLAAATIEYVGKDTRGQKTIRLKDKDGAIAFVKKGM